MAEPTYGLAAPAEAHRAPSRAARCLVSAHP